MAESDNHEFLVAAAAVGAQVKKAMQPALKSAPTVFDLGAEAKAELLEAAKKAGALTDAGIKELAKASVNGVEGTTLTPHQNDLFRALAAQTENGTKFTAALKQLKHESPQDQHQVLGRMAYLAMHKGQQGAGLMKDIFDVFPEAKNMEFKYTKSGQEIQVGWQSVAQHGWRIETMQGIKRAEPNHPEKDRLNELKQGFEIPVLSDDFIHATGVPVESQKPVAPAAKKEAGRGRE